MLLVPVYLILLFPLIVVSFSPSVFLFRCVLHPLPLPLSSCLGCIPPLIGLPPLRFYAVASSLFLLYVCFLFMFSILSRRCPLLTTSLSVLFCLLSMLISDSRFDLVWFRLSCDHGWIRSGSVNVRKQQQQLLWIRTWSRVVYSRLPRERLRGCSHAGSRVRLPRWWFRPLLPSSVPLRDRLPRARLRRRSCPLGRLASVGLLRASLWCRSCPLGRLDSVELLRAFLRRRLFPCGRLDTVELLRAFLRCRSFPRGRLEVERVVEGVDLDRASRTVVVGDRSALLAPWCVARVDDGMLPGFLVRGKYNDSD